MNRLVLLVSLGFVYCTASNFAWPTEQVDTVPGEASRGPAERASHGPASLESIGEERAETPGSQEQSNQELRLPAEPLRSENSNGELAPQSPPATSYRIQSDDTLSSIAQAHGCTSEELREANGFSVDRSRVGRTIVIPRCDPSRSEPEPLDEGTTYTVRSGDFLENIATRFGCSLTEVTAANGMRSDALYTGRTLQIPACASESAEAHLDPDGEVTDGTLHLVRPGEDLGRIAALHGCTVDEVMQSNELNDREVRVGQRLLIYDCSGPPRPEQVRDSRANVTVIRDERTLEQLMVERGFRPPRQFLALLLELHFNSRRTELREERWFSWGATGYQVEGWNPASTIKIYAAIAAYREARRLGFSGEAHLTFHGWRRDHTFVLNELVMDAIGPSSNIAYNYLVAFVGFDRLHSEFFNPTNGFFHTALHRPYARRDWMRMGWASSLNVSPRITVREGRRTVEIPARLGSVETRCHRAACTSLSELAESMLRLMLQEQLPESETFGLHPEDLRFLRVAMRSPRTRGEEVVTGLGRSIDVEDMQFYHKAGYSTQWYSDLVYVYIPGTNRAWIVALAGFPGRDSLNRAARIIGEIISERSGL